MNQNEFKTLIKGMKSIFNNPSFIPDDFSATVWYAALKDLSYESCTKAFQKYIMTETREPKPADLRRMSAEETAEKEMSELEAWNLVYRTVCGLSYEALTDPGELQKSFDRLPEVCRIAVGNPHTLREWANMDTEQVETIEQSHFIRGYRDALVKTKRYHSLPSGMRITGTENERLNG